MVCRYALADLLTIVYTNDLHLRLHRLDAIEAVVAEERATGVPVLLLDAGDAWHDYRRPIDAVWGAEAMIEWMNRMGYAAMALGNHELYWGRERVAKLVEQATFPLLAANLTRRGGLSVPWAPAARVDAGGLAVRIFGVITGELLPYLDDPWMHHQPPESTLDRWLTVEPPADLTIVLAHLSVDEAIHIAQRVSDIDLIITGHSHERTHTPIDVKGTAIVQAGAFARYFGRIRLDVSPDGQIEILEHKLLTTEKAPSEIAQGLDQLLRVGLVLAVSVLLLLL